MFSDRVEAGRRLAERLLPLKGRDDVVVVGLPRGGVPVAFEVATRLHVPLDVIVVRKLGVPYRPELAMGAIGEDGVRILDEHIVAQARVSQQELEAVEVRERAELERRTTLFRQGRPRVPLAGAVAVIVDDGIATGSTVKAACRVARELGAAQVVVAAPVAPIDTEARLRGFADDIVLVERPAGFRAVGQFYEHFDQTDDAEVVALLQRAARSMPGEGHRPVEESVAGEGRRLQEEVRIPVPDAMLEGRLDLPPDPLATVVFVHGSGSSRHSPRNRYVAEGLGLAGLGTLLFDLLTPAEERDRANVFDIELLAARLTAVTDWLTGHEEWRTGPIAFFGASTGAAAALRAAAGLGPRVAAVVSRGGRPDLTGELISDVVAPTMFIVGGKDRVVLDLNRTARARMRCESTLEIIPGAGHLFEEPGALDQVVALSRDWFVRHIPHGRSVGSGG
ncbi:MAG: phosphoribosyltransferase family protein [Dermatophilaceae bacterium]